MDTRRNIRFLERRGVLIGLIGLLLAGLAGRSAASEHPPAPANIPGIFFSALPALIPIVGHDDRGVADPRGEIVVALRDLANNPIAGSLVVVDFSDCPDVGLCVDPHDPGAVVDCGTRTVRKVTGVGGEARFRIVGCSIATPGGPGASGRCARVYADGFFGGWIPVAIYDLAGCDGLNGGDLSAWCADFFTQAPVGRSDYDGDGAISAADLSLWLGYFWFGSSLTNCGSAGRCAP